MTLSSLCAARYRRSVWFSFAGMRLWMPVVGREADMRCRAFSERAMHDASRCYASRYGQDVGTIRGGSAPLQICCITPAYASYAFKAAA